MSNSELTTYTPEQQRFIAACEQAQALQLADSVGTNFQAIAVLQTLTEILTDDFMTKNIMPLMNRAIGFLTDRTGKPNREGRIQPLYDVDVVRDAFIDAASAGLLATGNQFNIIAGRMYPTKEGFTALLRKLGVKYLISIALEPSTMQGFANLTCSINYEYKGEKRGYKLPVQVKADAYSTPDQLKGKAERRAKKNLYEYLTGLDFGEGDAESAQERIIDEQPQPEPQAVQQAREATVAERRAALRARKAEAAANTETGEVADDGDMPEGMFFGSEQ